MEIAVINVSACYTSWPQAVSVICITVNNWIKMRNLFLMCNIYWSAFLFRRLGDDFNFGLFYWCLSISSQSTLISKCSWEFKDHSTQRILPNSAGFIAHIHLERGTPKTFGTGRPVQINRQSNRTWKVIGQNFFPFFLRRVNQLSSLFGKVTGNSAGLPIAAICTTVASCDVWYWFRVLPKPVRSRENPLALHFVLLLMRTFLPISHKSVAALQPPSSE